MGRFEHEAAAFDRRGNVYLTEDAGEPFGCLYRFRPNKPLRGRGSLHAGGSLAAMKIAGVTGDLSIVQTPGTVLPFNWIDVPNPDPGAGDTPVREQVIAAGATPIMKAEGLWTGLDGSVWFVSSRGDGPNAEDEEDRSAAVHAGQIWRIDPEDKTIELVVLFPAGSPFDGPDNITAGPTASCWRARTARTLSGWSGSTRTARRSRLRSTRKTTRVRGRDVFARRRHVVRQHPGRTVGHLRDHRPLAPPPARLTRAAGHAAIRARAGAARAAAGRR